MPQHLHQLAVHTGGIGDFILACPAIEQLAAEGPLEIAGYRERVALAVLAGLADRAHDIDTIGFHSVFTAPSAALVTFLEQFTRVVVWMRDNDGSIERGLRLAGVEDVRIVPGLPPDSWTRHASEYYCETLGLPPAPPVRLKVRPAELPVDVVIHPGSGGRRKNWPLERFIAVAHHFRSRGRVITWCRGPAEEDLALPEVDAIFENLELTELAEALSAARLYLGNDSGVTHLAAAVGCPTVALFGPTDPKIWAPHGEEVAVVCADPWPEANAVIAAAQTIELERPA